MGITAYSMRTSIPSRSFTDDPTGCRVLVTARGPLVDRLGSSGSSPVTPLHTPSQADCGNSLITGSGRSCFASSGFAGSSPLVSTIQVPRGRGLAARAVTFGSRRASPSPCLQGKSSPLVSLDAATTARRPRQGAVARGMDAAASGRRVPGQHRDAQETQERSETVFLRAPLGPTAARPAY
jgi:hypothetical protein